MMVWEIDYLPDQKLINIKTRGDIPYLELPKQFEEVVHLADEVRTNRFLFDDTELHIDVSTVDIYEIPKLLISAGVSRSSQIAILISPDENRVDNYQFLETVCVNQGLRVKVFGSADEAIEWLNTA